MTRNRNHSAAFKAQVALAALKGDKTINELAALHSVHPSVIRVWKKRLLDGATELFQASTKSSSAEHEALQAQLYEQIGRLQTGQRRWLSTAAARRAASPRRRRRA